RKLHNGDLEITTTHIAPVNHRKMEGSQIVEYLAQIGSYRALIRTTLIPRHPHSQTSPVRSPLFTLGDARASNHRAGTSALWQRCGREPDPVIIRLIFQAMKGNVYEMNDNRLRARLAEELGAGKSHAGICEVDAR
ncbi:MAG: hypothetical protein P1V20_30930, partial [Verrucomicrobiales bacterium]|nr:hypothetical protein [Verrucomicrobiales bacterium]